MRIVVKDKRFGGTLRARYTLDIDIDYKTVPGDLELTRQVIEQYKRTKNNIGYTTFRGLAKEDIITILSAVKRQEAIVNVNRMGHCAYYKLGIMRASSMEAGNESSQIFKEPN